MTHQANPAVFNGTYFQMKVITQVFQNWQWLAFVGTTSARLTF